MYILILIDVDQTWWINTIDNKPIRKILIFDVEDNYLSRGL